MDTTTKVREITPELVQALHVATEALVIFWDADTEDAAAAISQFVNGTEGRWLIDGDVVREALESAGFDDEELVAGFIATLRGEGWPMEATTVPQDRATLARRYEATAAMHEKIARAYRQAGNENFAKQADALAKKCRENARDVAR